MRYKKTFKDYMNEGTIIRAYEDDLKNLSTNEILAIERTILANERTALSYIRTFIGLFGGGIGLMKLFSSSNIFLIFGIILIICSILMLISGINRYIKVKKTTGKFEKLIRPDSKKE